MKSNKLKKILAVAIASTMISTIAPVAASAAWLKDSQNNWSWIENGSKAKGWKQVDGTWYHFDANGKMQTGWIKTADSKWYYMADDGGMKTGWVQDANRKWYNLASSGEMKTGWLKDGNGKWYYLASDGEMKTGWVKDTDGKWYFMDVSGAMQTGVVEIQGKTYVLEASGAMATVSVVVGGQTYAIDASGALIGDKLPTPEKSFTNNGVLNPPVISSTGTTENNNIEKTTSSSSGSSSSSSSSSSSNSGDINGKDMNYDQPGIYGPASGMDTANNVSVNSKGVTLKNIHIKGNLELGEGIGDGDVSLENVIVDGTTIVRGGGQNSIHFINSTLATVIVNKNDGKIRIVVEGNSQVAEVQLESPAKLEEAGLSGGATGFNNVNVTENVQTGSNLQVELVGRFETINSRATQVRMQLDESTDIQSLILNVVAQVLGTGRINTAIINSRADGSTLYSRPENMVLHARSVSLRDQLGNSEEIRDSYSTATSTSITDVKLNMDSIKVNTSNFVAGLTSSDFNVSAKLDGQDYTLQNLSYDSDDQRFTFDPVSLDGNLGKALEVTITPASDKITGTGQSDEVTVQNGFSGRITDIQKVGIAGIAIKFRQGADSRDGEVVTTVVTDEDGYYTAYLAPGQYTGEISGFGVIKTYMYASSESYRFNVEQNETAIRATGMDSVKIVLTWGENPYDEDSHLEGPTVDGQGRFHTWYGDKIYEGEDGIRYADLDWDDVNSYGPETTTIYNLVNGKYRFYVHNYSGDAPLVGSGARVEVYKGSNTAPVNTFTIPNDTEKQNARYWFVFDMNVENDGETINVSEINELRGSLMLKTSNTAEASYVIEDISRYDEMGEITGVPAGTVANLKADLLPYDGGILKVFPAGTYVSNASEFDVTTELTDDVNLANNQIVAIKAQDGTVKSYRIKLYGTPVLLSDYLTQQNTTPGAVTLTWNKATDDITPQNELNYSLYMEEDEPHNSIESWENNATLLTQANDINRYDVTNLDDTLDYYFQLIVKDKDGNKTAYATEHRRPSTANNSESPVLLSDFLTQHDSTTPGAVTLTWYEATDNTTSQSNLKYYLYMSENQPYNSIEDWEDNATLLNENDLVGIDRFEVSELDDTLDYYFQLIVEDADGNKKAYATEHRHPVQSN